jgi:hypothetical protein
MVGSGATRERLAWAFLYVVILAIGVALGIQVVVDGYSPVPIADFWAQFPFIERGVRGDFDLGDLWAQWNEHRIFLARLHFLLDYSIFDGTNVFLFATIATSCLLLAAIFAIAVWSDSRDWLLALGTLAVAGTSALPLAGIENLALAFNVHFVQTFLFATISILAVVAGARSVVASRQAIWSGVAAIAGVAATYSTANGVLTWVVVVLLGMLLPLERRFTAALAITGAVTAATFLWHFEFSEGRTLSDPVGLVHFVALYLGSAPTPSPGTAAIAGAAGLALFALLGRQFWMGRSDRSALVPFGFGVAAFVVLTAAVTAVGRLDFGTSQALASRYSIGSFTFWLGLFVGFLPTARERLRPVAIGVPAYLAGAAVVALVLGYMTIPPDSEVRAALAGREATVVAYRAGVEDPSNERYVLGGALVTGAFRWMEREMLGPWSPGGLVDGMRVTGPRSRTDRACLGEIESARPIRGGSRLGGWIAAPYKEQSSRHLVVLDAGGRRSGLGLVGMPRSGVELPGGEDGAGFVAYVPGEPATPLQVILLAEDRARGLCRLTWVERRGG